MACESQETNRSSLGVGSMWHRYMYIQYMLNVGCGPFRTPGILIQKLTTAILEKIHQSGRLR